MKYTWEEIKKQYPHQYVALSDIEYGDNKASIKKAVVKYTDKDKTYDELALLYIQGDIVLRYTTLDEDEMKL